MIKKIIFSALIFIGIVLLVPTLLVTTGGSALEEFNEELPVVGNTNKNLDDVEVKKESSNSIEHIEQVAVFRAGTEVIENVPLEEYIVGVVGSEMPASYEIEALKAQALTARTYLIRQLLEGGDLNLPEGADVTDTELHQVFQNEVELEEAWGGDFDWKISRIRQAVYETEGQVITYEGEPITATFFSTSNGYTENSEEYWENEIPYLRSVESPWDTESPRYKDEREFTIDEVETLLQVTIHDKDIGEISSRTTGGRVAELIIDGHTFSGREIREALELDSSDFTWEIKGDKVVVETRGWGHGVGMSQFGADGMAREGYSYEDIINYYYKGVTIEEAESVLVHHKHTDKPV
ncbi:stage II sporulation protein D [Salipaludibacillus agaradhaerens]|uniref:stage II sporulation protein D n=1 Tax=Salipaludibacillus agaradhaerens TaxID=76935 RepID=UPI0027E31AD3|nr:stage II sporulation protein D [Salipaludibacillus agaradhaerens]